MKCKLFIQNKKVNSTFFLLLLLLLVLRFPVEISLSFNIIPISKNLGSYIYQIGTYLITSILIFLERQSLSNYNMGFYSLAIFMISPLAELLSGYLVTKTIELDLWFKIGISVCLLVLMLLYGPKLRKRSLKGILVWVFIAIAICICCGIFAGNLSRLQDDRISPCSPSFPKIITSFFIQLGNAAAMEEPLFRGFLWGLLKKLHWNDYWIWLFQAALFWLGHIFYLGAYSYSFWIIIPVEGLVLGLIAWHSKSIGTSMIVHGLYNSIANIVAHCIW